MTPGTANRRLDSLTGLRAVAALLVVVYHARFTLTKGAVRTLLGPLFATGRVGVSFFFVLSGFVLVWSARGGNASHFYRRRLSRIYPAYLVALALATVMLLGLHEAVTAKAFALSALLIQSWIPKHSAFYSINPVAWSLSCEAFFYLAFPIALPILARLGPTSRCRLFWITSGSVIIINLAGGIFAPSASVSFGRSSIVWFVYIFPPIRFLEFLLGMLLALRIRSGWTPSLGFTQASLLAFGAYLLTSFRPDRLGTEAVTLVPICCLVAAAAHRDAQGDPTWLSRGVCRRLGELSYCIYLLHQLPIRWLDAHQHAQSGLIAMLEVAAIVAAAYVSALGMHELIEKPADRRLRGDGRVSISVQSEEPPPLAGIPPRDCW